MRFVWFFSFFLLSSTGFAQGITQIQQKALNSYVDYANHASEEVTAIVKSIIDFYPSIASSKKNKSYFNRPYTCPVQLEDYYLNQALQNSKALSNASALNDKLKLLRKASENIDTQCKALDTYYKLQDYKQDNYLQAETLVSQFPEFISNFRQQQNSLMKELEATYQKLRRTATGAYSKTDGMMRQQIKQEQGAIDAWTFNLSEQIHTGWPVEKLEQSILDTDKQLKLLNAYTPALNYPASSMYTSYRNSLASILDTKRAGLDDYNAEAKKSDRHSNNVYMDLINYFNGALVSDYNTFITFAIRDNYLGLKMLTYVPQFEIRTEPKHIKIEAKPFEDIEYQTLIITPQKNSISNLTFSALNNYIDLINEALREVDYIQPVLRNLNSSAAYYKDLTSYQGKGGLHYDYEDYKIPLSIYQKTITESGAIPSAFSKSLNDQAQVLLNILKEIDQLSALLERETKEKRYEQDNLSRLYTILGRNNELLAVFDVKKEQLYKDVRAVYESYPPKNTTSAWFVSGKALQQLTDLNHDALFQAKDFYKSNADIKISTSKIDEALRQVISNEYTNMKGIEKYGRNNGLCPYTPYEDLPQTAKILSEKFNKLKPAGELSGYTHPYHDMVYLYNEMVDDLNKFSELSKDILLLKEIRQPELFELKLLHKKQETHDSNYAVEQNQAGKNIQNKQYPIHEVKPGNETRTHASVSKTQVVHDTVYIEKRDTVYLEEPGEDIRSMEGYATNNMVLLLDVSGSMNAPEKLPLLKKSVLDLLTMMRPEDEVSIVIYSGKARVLLKATSFRQDEKIKKVIESLKSSGKTDGNAGLKLAYKVADENYVRAGNNRIILATDGEFAVSDDTFRMIEDFVKNDIYISVFNFGKSGSSSKNLEKLASAGKGNYEYITSGNIDFKLIREAKAKRKK